MVNRAGNRASVARASRDKAARAKVKAKAKAVPDSRARTNSSAVKAVVRAVKPIRPKNPVWTNRQSELWLGRSLAVWQIGSPVASLAAGLPFSCAVSSTLRERGRVSHQISDGCFAGNRIAV